MFKVRISPFFAILVALWSDNTTFAFDTFSSCSYYGRTFSCPGSNDNPVDVFCCEGGFSQGVYCCSDPVSNIKNVRKGDGIAKDLLDQDVPFLSDSKAEQRSVIKGLGKLIAIIFGLAVFVVFFCLVVCCCCPCCWLHKRRQQGQVIRSPGEDNRNAQPPHQPSAYAEQSGGYQMMHQVPGSGYPQQQAAYPPTPQPGYPHAQPRYPPAQQLGYPLTQPAGGVPYGPQHPMNPPPYPGLPSDGSRAPTKQTAEYHTQPAYNPGALPPQ